MAGPAGPPIPRGKHLAPSITPELICPPPPGAELTLPPVRQNSVSGTLLPPGGHVSGTLPPGGHVPGTLPPPGGHRSSRAQIPLSQSPPRGAGSPGGGGPQIILYPAAAGGLRDGGGGSGPQTDGYADAYYTYGAAAGGAGGAGGMGGPVGAGAYKQSWEVAWEAEKATLRGGAYGAGAGAGGGALRGGAGAPRQMYDGPNPLAAAAAAFGNGYRGMEEDGALPNRLPQLLGQGRKRRNSYEGKEALLSQFEHIIGHMVSSRFKV
jgi:hypothetical protein